MAYILQGFFSVFWEMAFFVCLGIFHRQKNNFGKITLCSYSINIDVIVCFIFIHNYHKGHLFNVRFLFLSILTIGVLHTSDFLYVPPSSPLSTLFLLKYYCLLPIPHNLYRICVILRRRMMSLSICNKSYLCNPQQKNDVCQFAQ